MRESMRLAVSLLLLTGCHNRFRKAATSMDAVRLDADPTAPPDVDLGRIYTLNSGFNSTMTESWNLTQFSREVQFASMLEAKVDKEGMAAAFIYGVREQLGAGPPFAATDDATDVLYIDVVDWGLTVMGFGAPAAFTYRVRVTGEHPDGAVFYRTTFRCVGNAGRARWLDSMPWDRRFEPALEALPDTEVQETFDKAAFICGQELAAQMMRHSG